MFGGGGGVIFKALRNDMGCQHETLRGVTWAGVGVKMMIFSVTYLLNVPLLTTYISNIYISTENFCFYVLLFKKLFRLVKLAANKLARSLRKCRIGEVLISTLHYTEI